MTTETNPSGASQIPDKDRMTGEQVDEATKGYKGRERWQAAARIAEQRAYELGLEDGVDTGESRRVEIARLMEVWAAAWVGPADYQGFMLEPLMVSCPGCVGTGKMWNGSQCKVCYGATTVKAVVAPEDVVTPK